MNRTLKWIILSSEQSTLNKAALDRLASELDYISDYDPRLSTPHARRIAKALENPPADDVSVICYIDKDYPSRLKNIPDPPAVLYVRGDPSLLSASPSAAVIGSRDASAYGIGVTADFCRDFCEYGITVVSGGAKGVDSAAAETTIKYGGKTIAVFGCGIDVCYPWANKNLFQKIIDKGGCLVSEYFFGTKPMPAYFPRRNRIIAALGDCCVVTEAGLKSGSLLTANLALSMRKPLFSVPGNINSKTSAGTNYLIKTGASMALSGDQVAADLKLMLSFSENPPRKKSKFTRLPLAKSDENKKPKTTSEKTKAFADLSPQEALIANALKDADLTIAQIAKASGLNEVTLAPLLVMMELKGLIKKEYGETFSLNM